MPQISLPDGSVRAYDNPLTIAEVAKDIGPGLAKAAIAGKVNGEIVDASALLTEDCEVAIVTAKDDAGLEVIRHSTAHLLAQAVKQLFPEAQVTIGPVIENGFYYDFSYAPGFSEDDLEAIEKRMADLAKADYPVERSVMERAQAVEFFQQQGEIYKAEIIADIPKTEQVSLYGQNDFIDLCRGPHVPSTGHLQAFKLMKVAGAYWRGDSNNEMLQRIYGTAWADKKQLKAYLRQLEQAEKRDHRKLGKQLNLFHMQEEAPGMVFWHPKGWALYQVLQQYMRAEQRKRNYQEINTPEVVDLSLWKRSGHADKFGGDMFSVESEGRKFALKPMNCPCHVQVFNQGLKSYRDLPLRFAEYGSCHRNELSGALHGLLRLRGFVQDDGHIFCTEQQIQSEVGEFIDFLHHVYRAFGFTEIIYRLATRPENRVGSDASWDKAEAALAQALDDKNLPWEMLEGEGAFYGPKIEFSLKDSIGRIWQCGTMQVDFSMPGRLDAQYVDEQGRRQTPVMLHRALLGTFERFIGILIEHWEGKFPVWFAPVQAVVMNITDKQSEYVLEIANTLKKQGFRVEADLRNEKIGFKIREHTLQRIPYLLIVGDREVETKSIAVRAQNGEDLGCMSVERFIADSLSGDA
ncbi:threonine--tRNA ligase [Candidatus Spongiihabitans sp.]|uniref:threonine--tRNA ligase n=1 Tax=Candidatus Spongiihabitans sp. TaxID=3101308 RepID=UPI003C7A89DC